MEVRFPPPSGTESLLASEALRFLGELCERMVPPREMLLRQRRGASPSGPAAWRPGFSAETAKVRHGDWSVPPPPPDLRDRRVEITGPTDRKMMINALNSGAQVFMADFEDSHAPRWDLTLRGQLNLRDAVQGKLAFRSPEGKEYRLRSPHATLTVRPRGMHLEEPGLSFGGRPVPASLVDVGLYLFHNATGLSRSGRSVSLYLPKIQSAEEAAWWESTLALVEEGLSLPLGTVRTTVLIETLPAAFQMQEVLHALRSRVLGLNFGRWDYLFSFIKTLRSDPRYVLPERSALSMDTPFMTAASRLLVESCHARGAQAIGGMAADIPVKEDAALNTEAVDRVTADKRRELAQGYDGTWVAHPALVPIALRVFQEPRPLAGPSTEASVRRGDPEPSALLQIPAGQVTEAGVRANLNVALQYFEAWLRGTGAVAIHHRMEDTATAEICRAQLWQWVHLGVPLPSGRSMSAELFRDLLQTELPVVRGEVGEDRWRSGAFPEASRLLETMVLSPEMDDFLPQRAASELAEVAVRFRT